MVLSYVFHVDFRFCFFDASSSFISTFDSDPQIVGRVLQDGESSWPGHCLHGSCLEFVSKRPGKVGCFLCFFLGGRGRDYINRTQPVAFFGLSFWGFHIFGRKQKCLNFYQNRVLNQKIGGNFTPKWMVYNNGKPLLNMGWLGGISPLFSETSTISSFGWV